MRVNYFYIIIFICINIFSAHSLADGENKSMDFWQIIKDAKVNSPDKTDISLALESILNTLAADDVHDFDKELSDKISELYSEDILRVASLLKGPLTDDGFHYFRLYLILQGEETYTLSLEKPEDAGLKVQKFYMFSFIKYEVAEFTHIPSAVYKNKTGKDIKYNLSNFEKVKLEAWQDQDTDLKSRFPKLYKWSKLYLYASYLLFCFFFLICIYSIYRLIKLLFSA